MPVNPLRRALHLLLAFALVLSQLMLLVPSTAIAAPVVAVNSIGDAGDDAIGDHACTTGNLIGTQPECTLRAAMEEANASDEVVSIVFGIPSDQAAGGLYVISPGDALPTITQPVSINAATQSGYSDSPIVIVDGAGIPGSGDWPDGFLVATDDSTIRGLVVRNFHDDGIEIHGDRNRVLGNHIHGNDDGVLVETGSDNVIGGGSSQLRNIIYGNAKHGVSVDRGNGNVVRNNYIGVHANGSSAAPNGAQGVEIWGGTTRTTVRDNVISGNSGHGVRIAEAADQTSLRTNLIGTTASGSAGLANGLDGVHVDGASIVNITAGNVISGNSRHGVVVTGGTDRTNIVGNLVGTSGAGTSSVANGGHGVHVVDAGRVDLRNGNVVSGNSGHGVLLDQGAGDVRIIDNLIGTDGSGGAALPNGGDGVHADVDDVRIQDNQVSYNGGDGLRLEQEGAEVWGNSISSNVGDGIDTGSGTTGSDIGGVASGRGNVISSNGGHGVALRNHTGTQAAIVGNSIYGNAGLGIDLPERGSPFDDDPGEPNLNDPGDGDAGTNDQLNYPEIVGVEEVSGTVYAAFDMDVPNGRYRVEFFLNPTGADPSGHGEGESLVSGVNIQKTSGASSFTHTFPGTAGGELTTTATRCTNNACTGFAFTSEFGPVHTIQPGNQAPVLAPIDNLDIPEGARASFTATATDPDGDDLTFDLLAGPGAVPAGASIDADTGEFTWDTTEADGPGTYMFDVRVTDDGAAFDSDSDPGNDIPMPLDDRQTITIEVDEVNQAPVLDDPGDHTVDELDLLTFTVVGNDDDLPANTLTYVLGGDAPSGATIDPNTGVVQWAPNEDQGPLAWTFDVGVSDGTETDYLPVNVAVAEVNEAPLVTDPGDQADDEADIVSLSIVATDGDIPANTLTYSATGLPPGLTIDGSTGMISGTISYTAAAGSPHDVTVTVSDGVGGTTGVDFTWVTDNTNRPPSLAPISNKTVTEQTALTFNASAGDPDAGPTLTFSLDGAPSGASINPSSGAFTWTPSENQGPGSYTFDVEVSDNDPVVPLTDAESVTIAVSEANRAPVLANPGNHFVDEQTTLTFTASATDPDVPANDLSFGLSANAPSGASIDSTTGVFTWTPTETQGPLPHTFNIIVSDGTLIDSEPVTITVREVNRSPIVSNPGPQHDAEAETIDLSIQATDQDRPVNSLTYAAAGLPPGLEIDPNTGRITGTIAYSAAASSPYDVTVTVTDSGSPLLSGSVSFSWITENTNRRPTLDPISNKVVDELTPLAFVATATDLDPGTTMTFILDGAPKGASINPVTGAVTWTPNEAQGPDTYLFDVGVVDNDALNPLAHSVPVAVTVREVNVAPVAGDDSATTSEDTAVTIPVLGNDSDQDIPVNRLRISDITRPRPGGSVEVVSGGIAYTPAPHYHGPVQFDYTLFDGITTDTATVSIDVSSVNDIPVALDDSFRLTNYQPAELDILANDHDADSEPLGITLRAPLPAEVDLNGNKVVFDPVSGWTGTVTFDYVVHDPHGASATASVEVIVGNEVLVGAQSLAEELGNRNVNFDPPAPSFEAGGLSLIHLDGITLLADSFFQTVDALRIPLGFLGVTVAMVVGFGTTSGVPALVFGSRRRHWAVVRLGRQQRLPAYSEPGGRKVVYNYDPTAAAIVSTGKFEMIGKTEWVPVDTPNGKAWIYRQYLTEHVDLQAFASDPRPVRLVHELADRLRKGKSIASLISDEGLLVALTGSPSQIAPEELTTLMGDRRLRHLTGLGTTINTPEEFTIAVARPFLEAYDATPEITADTPHSRSALIPTECWNFPYLAMGPGNGVQPWLVFFEYKDGKAVIAGLGIDE